jgi:hypothetical protein
MTKLETNHAGATNLGFGKGKVDPVEAGRRGGIASGMSRRQRPQRELEQRIASSRNGAAQLGLLKVMQARDGDLIKDRARIDYAICDLLDEQDAEQAKLERLQERSRELEAELRGKVDALEAREAELRRQLETDDGVRTWLELVGEERATAAAIALGWAEDNHDEDDGDVAD